MHYFENLHGFNTLFTNGKTLLCLIVYSPILPFDILSAMHA